MKKTRIVFSTVLISMALSAVAFAGDGTQGQWKRNEIGWRWENADSSYPVSKWEWLDGNGDGVAECYYFDDRGYMASNMDVGGYWVNADGQWVDMYGTVQTKVMNNNVSFAPAAQGNENENGNGSATGNGNTVVNNSSTSFNDESWRDMFLPNGEINLNFDIAGYNAYLEAKKNAMFDGQSHENWKDYLGYSIIPEWVYDKYVEQGAHVYWNGSEIAVDWPNGIKPGSEADTERKFWEDYNSTTLEEKREYILEQINKYRKKKGAEPLEFNDELNDYAQMRAEELEEHFGHARPNGESFSKELELEYRTYGFGECGANVGSYKNVASGWYNSSKHKKIMTDKKAKICGIGVNGRYIDLITYDGYL